MMKNTWTKKWFANPKNKSKILKRNRQISKTQKGVPRPYLLGNKNPMRNPISKQKNIDAQKGVPRPYNIIKNKQKWFRMKVSKGKLGKPRPDMVGKNNYFYENGKSNEPYSTEWKTSLKNQIRKRDKKCAICRIYNHKHKKKYGDFLSVHHINGNKEDTKETNLVCLCRKHHGKIQKIQYELQDYFKFKLLQVLRNRNHPQPL